MSLYKSKTYLSDVEESVDSCLSISSLFNKSVFVAGASGLIGSFLVDFLGFANDNLNAGISIIAAGRNIDHLNNRFADFPYRGLTLEQYDVTKGRPFVDCADFVVHAASNAHPSAMISDPVGTIFSNVDGVRNLLEWTQESTKSRLLYVSSGEVYGQCVSSSQVFDEEYQGFVDPLAMRSSYPLSKRMAENICVSYIAQYGCDCVIARPCHTFGPCATKDDSRANVQFVNDAISGRDIVMKSDGKQVRSYNYIADAVSALVAVMVRGETGRAYNIANPNIEATISDFAEETAQLVGCSVVHKHENALAMQNQTPIMRQVLSTERIRAIGWSPRFTLKRGIEHTITSIKEGRAEEELC